MADSAVDICRTILNAVAGDASVQAFLATNLPGRTLRLFLGLDANKLPDEGDLPWCAAIPRSAGLHDQGNHREPSILMVVSIAWGAITPAANYTEFPGYEKIIDFAEIIQTAALTSFSQNALNLSEISIEADYPYFRASWDFRVPTES